MAGISIPRRPLTDLEAAVISRMLAAGRDGSAEYLAQLPYSEVVSTWGVGLPSVDLEVRLGPAPAGGGATVRRCDGATDGIVANGAVTDSAGRPIGEVILWAAAGRLSGIEYAWYTDERPTHLPEPDRIDLL